MKTGKRRSWSAIDVRTLKSLARKKTAARKIAKKLKRTEGATRQKAFSMGLSLDTRLFCNGPDEVKSPLYRHAAELALLSVVDAKAATLCC